MLYLNSWIKEIKIGRYTAKNLVFCVNENLNTKNLLGLEGVKKIAICNSILRKTN
jgi:hypothetical protein